MDRRKFFAAPSLLAVGAAFGGEPAAARVAEPACQGDVPLRPLAQYEPLQQYRIGYTSNTRGGWEGDPWKGIREGREVGFRYFEIFGLQFSASPPGKPVTTWPVYYPHDAEGLMRRMHELGANFVSITGAAQGAPTAFHDPAQQKAVVENHFSMARFSRKFGTDVWKTNLGSRRRGGATDADLKQMAITCTELGRRMREELGMRLAIHPHLGNQLQDEREILYMMENTDERYVGLTLDTGHITMAGMDPLVLAKKLGKRVLEFHLKDVHPDDLGGAKVVPAGRDLMKDPFFFPLGKGGVDFVALKAFLDSISWRGFLNVELDSSPFIPPKESARISANYIQTVLNIPL